MSHPVSLTDAAYKDFIGKTIHQSLDRSKAILTQQGNCVVQWGRSIIIVSATLASVRHHRTRVAAQAVLKGWSSSPNRLIAEGSLRAGSTWLTNASIDPVTLSNRSEPDAEYDITNPPTVLGAKPVEDDDLLSLLKTGAGMTDKPAGTCVSVPDPTSRFTETVDGSVPPHLVTVLKNTRKPADYIAALRA